MLVVTTVSYYSPDLLSFNTVLHSSRSGDDGFDLQNSSNSGQYLGGIRLGPFSYSAQPTRVSSSYYVLDSFIHILFFFLTVSNDHMRKNLLSSLYKGGN